MKTIANVAKVWAQLTRAAVLDLELSSDPTPDTPGATKRRRDALDSLNAVAASQEEYSVAFEPETISGIQVESHLKTTCPTSPDARSAQSV